MVVTRTVKNIVQYITEAFARIFSPTDDQYPAIGVQPFEGTIYNSNSQLD